MAKEDGSMTKEELKNIVMSAMDTMKPKGWRKGQFVFNFIDANYGVARAVQFEDRVDCFFRDDKIDDFIEKCALRIK